MGCQSLFIDPQNYLHIMRTFPSYIENEPLNLIKASLENLWQRTIQLSDIFPKLIGVQSQRKRLPGADRIRCGQSGTPSTNIHLYDGVVGVTDLGVMLLWGAAWGLSVTLENTTNHIASIEY